jgi:tripartite-type tricarboxylate transporter receptor subunit TctC
MLRMKTLAGCVLAFGIANGALAQAYPEKMVRVILPFPAGTGADAVVRTTTQKLSVLWGQPVVVENRPGAGGTIGVAAAAKSPADGYVLLAHSSTYAVSPAVYASLPYDPERDFAEIAPIGTQPYVLVAGPSSGIKSVAELITAAKEKPGTLNYGSAGMGSSTHLVGEMLRATAGIQVAHIPYTKIAEVNADTMTGRIAYWFPPLGLALPLVRDGRLLALAVTSSRRTEFLPDAPTMAEAGVAGLEATNWFGMWAPARTPSDLVERIARDVARSVAAPDVRARLAVGATEPMRMTRPEFARFVRSETESAARIARAAGVKAE